MTGPGGGDPASRVDALVASIEPRVRAPTVCRCDVVLVTGPRLSGASEVAAALRDRLPDQAFAEAADLLAGQVPTAVVFVVSAAAALTDSDCELLDTVVAHTDVVIGVVSKIDVHRQWPEVLTAARDTLTARAPRYRHVSWVGVAAPGLGEPRVGELVAQVRTRLAGPDVQRRNRLRSWESQLRAVVHSHAAGGAARRARVALLREQRDAVLRQRRLARSEQTIALRSQVAQARLQLSHFARSRCNSVRSELLAGAAGMTRRRLPGFEAYLRSRVDEVIAEVDRGAATHLAGVARGLNLAVKPPEPACALPKVEVAGPALRARRLETQLMMLLGAGFGLGVALTLSRLLAGLAPRLTAAGATVCAAVGLAVTVWVVSTRGLLRDRAVLDRWVTEVIAALRSAAEELVAGWVLAAEPALSAGLAERSEAESAQIADQLAVLDGELREHAAAARAAALRDREMPALRRALDAVRAELGEPNADDGSDPTG